MDWNLKITDMAGAYIEHSTVITNFVATVYPQLKKSACRVYGDNVQYKWNVNGVEKKLIPDATINCRIQQRKGNSFFDTPRFVMEVLSPSTETYDRTEKMELYRQQEVEEYWIVDWRTKTVEIYELDYDENDVPKYYLWKTITEANKEDLRLLHFPNIKITFDELFSGIDF